jgi:hypothetical protein
LQIACIDEGAIDALFQSLIQCRTGSLEGVAQCGCGLCAVLGLSATGNAFGLGNGLFDAAGLLGCQGHGRGVGWQAQAMQGAQFIGPDLYLRQFGLWVFGSGLGQCEGFGEGGEDQRQLRAGVVQRAVVAWLDAAPVRTLLKLLGNALPFLDVGLQRLQGFGRVLPGLGGEHVDALGQQQRGFFLHHAAVLQFLDGLDGVGDLGAQAGQWLLGQGRARLGGFALPGFAIGNLEGAALQDGFGLLAPFLGNVLWVIGWEGIGHRGAECGLRPDGGRGVRYGFNKMVGQGRAVPPGVQASCALRVPRVALRRACRHPLRGGGLPRHWRGGVWG